MKSLAALLTGREYARVARVTTARIGHDPNRSKAQYLAELEITARELYPAKAGGAPTPGTRQRTDPLLREVK